MTFMLFIASLSELNLGAVQWEFSRTQFSNLPTYDLVERKTKSQCASKTLETVFVSNLQHIQATLLQSFDQLSLSPLHLRPFPMLTFVPQDEIASSLSASHSRLQAPSSGSGGDFQCDEVLLPLGP